MTCSTHAEPLCKQDVEFLKPVIESPHDDFCQVRPHVLTTGFVFRVQVPSVGGWVRFGVPSEIHSELWKTI